MKRISVPEDGVETLFGSYDENLKHFESIFNVRIRTQGHEILAEGDSPGPENVERVVNQLSSLSRDGYKVSTADVKTAADLVAQLRRSFVELLLLSISSVASQLEMLLLSLEHLLDCYIRSLRQ